MGVYDAEINNLRRNINQNYDRIQWLNNEIAELKDLYSKFEVVNKKVISVMNNIISGINATSNDNFTSYFKSRVNDVAQNSGIYNIDDTDTEDKAKIREKIISYEDEIRRLNNQISVQESDLSYYQNNNTEESKKGK